MKPIHLEIKGKAPGFPCPVCKESGTARTTEEISRTLRRLYYRCSNILCGHTWTAHLSFEGTLSPSRFGMPRVPLPMLDLALIKPANDDTPPDQSGPDTA